MASSDGYYILAYKFLYHDEARSHKSACEVQNLCSFSRNDMLHMHTLRYML